MSQPIPRQIPSAAPEALERMTLLEHLEELRKRILRSLIAVVVAFFACWAFAADIFSFLARPIRRLLPEGADLVYLSVTDPFVLYVKVAVLAAVFLSSPVLMFQFWRFVAPGLYATEKRYAIPFVVMSSCFFIGGGAFAYYVVFPFAAEFLIQLGEGLQPVLTVDRYFKFLLTVILGMGLMFELPIVILVLSQIGVVTPRFLMKHFRWAVLVIFILAALITPTPDVVNLCMFAVPTLLLYLLGVGAAAAVNWGKSRGKVEEPELADELPEESLASGPFVADSEEPWVDDFSPGVGQSVSRSSPGDGEPDPSSSGSEPK